jgi:glycosyltransferase involved in cell wall biosynthesis
MIPILYLSHTERLGGAEHSLLGLLERLHRKRFEPLVAVPEAGPLTDQLDALGVPWHAVPMVRLRRTRNPIRLLRYALAWRRARRAVRDLCDESGARIVHANSTTAFLFVPRDVRQRLRSVWHVRDIRLTGVRRVDDAMAQDAAAIIAVSDFIRRTVPLAAERADRTAVIHNGVDIESFTPGDGDRVRDELELGDAPVAGIVAQIVPWKGHDRFLEAMAAVAERIPDARFLVVGDNHFGDHPRLPGRLKRRANALGLADRVVFTGWRTDVLDVMRALDVLVVASDREPFGRVIVEAMACERPVVAFACGGPVEIIEDGRTGRLVEPFDLAALSDAVASLLADRARGAEMGRAGRAAACERFSAGAYAASVQDVYERVLSE